MKTNREKNLEHDAQQQSKVRPKQPEYNWKPLETVVRKWMETERDS